ncbi:hypothetical protein QV05_09460 [Gallibacterium genomosp. 1]|uniref:Polymerase n=1 Tax=Gallibacterium genomosp. 1 TaxID=155515 RepID=A0AB36DUI2_9PAST|nr:hypothetical protein [Gallibacterium genomosp. 1]OBW99716.1 hypothetical protein QV05_09460 [Gallibacterium genomosp. 1]
MKKLSKYLYRIIALFSLPFLLSSVGLFISMIPKKRCIFFFIRFFIQEKLLKYNLSFFIILLMADLLSKGFSLNIKYMEDNDIRDFAHSLLLSVVGTIILCFFFIETKCSMLFIFFIIFVHLFSIIETFQFYIMKKYKNWNVFTR